MRRISKPWPPQNVSPEGQAPQSMKEAERKFLESFAGAADLTTYARTEFDNLDKKKLREMLLKEQRYLCVYCQDRVEETTNPPPIEHWQPLSKSQKLALRWKNLYLSCAADGTCDTAKKDRRLVWDEADKDLPWPTDVPYHDWFGYTRGGKAYVQRNAPLSSAQRKALKLAIEDQHDGDRARESILNLNHPSLVAARKAVIDSERTRLNRDYKNRTASPDERHARARRMLERDKYPKYISVRMAWLTKTMGKNQ